MNNTPTPTGAVARLCQVEDWTSRLNDAISENEELLKSLESRIEIILSPEVAASLPSNGVSPEIESLAPLAETLRRLARRQQETNLAIQHILHRIEL